MAFMMRRSKAVFLSAAVLVLTIGGCRSTQEYQKLAKAGVGYANALDELLVEAGNIRVDFTSEQLIKDDLIKNQDDEDYKELSNIDEERLEILEKLRLHNRLLKRYFQTLDELASSDAPERAQTEIEGLVANLNKVGNELRSSSLIGNPGLISSGAKLVVGSQIRGALRDELEKRKYIIDQELKTQGDLLDKLGKIIEHDMDSIINDRELRTVIRPLIAEKPIASNAAIDSWIKNRREIITSSRNISQFAEASKAAKSFRTIFQDFVKGDLNSDRLSTLLTDIESFLVVVEQLRAD
jgi:hypothetical protein